MKTLFRLVLISFLTLPPVLQAESRWYDESAVDKGSVLFKQYCASCHGENAEKTVDWKKTDSNGKYPPPPLNGTAHAWHHSKELLKKTIREGGAKLGGVMPAFEGQFSDRDLDDLVAYFQSKWPDDLYEKWAERFLSAKAPAIEPIPQQVNTASAEDNMTRLLRLRIGNRSIPDPVKTPVEGIYQTQIGGQYGYLTQNGRYVFVGELIDLETGQNLTGLAKGKMALTELNKVALADKVIFPAKGEEKAVLNVFTDTSCPYCIKLHEEVGKLQEAGISVHYLPYPRGGQQGPGYQVLKQVWCAEDKPKAMSIAKDIEVGDLPAGDCEKGKFVDQGHKLGIKVGVNGTPSLFKSNGENIQGYVPYQELIRRVLTN